MNDLEDILLRFRFPCNLADPIAMPPVRPLASRIEPLKCMGSWYVQVAWPTPFDRDATNGLEQYTWNEEKEQVAVKYTFNSKSGAPTVVQQIGGVVKTTEDYGTEWWVKPKIGPFYLPFRAPYYVVDADTKGYSYLIASSPSTTGMLSWCYIMTRDKHVEDSFLEPLRTKAADAGWDLSKAQRMNHDKP